MRGQKGGGPKFSIFFHSPVHFRTFFSLGGSSGRGSRPWTTRIERLGFSEVISCDLRWPTCWCPSEKKSVSMPRSRPSPHALQKRTCKRRSVDPGFKNIFWIRSSNKFLGVSWSIKRNDDQQKQVLFQRRPLTKHPSLNRSSLVRDGRTTRRLKRSRLNINCARLRMVKGVASGSTSGLSVQNIFQSGRWQERHV